jgi:hypothetical protein
MAQRIGLWSCWDSWGDDRIASPDVMDGFPNPNRPCYLRSKVTYGAALAALVSTSIRRRLRWDQSRELADRSELPSIPNGGFLPV